MSAPKLTEAQRRALGALAMLSSTTTERAYTSNRTAVLAHEIRIEARTAKALLVLGLVNIDAEAPRFARRAYWRVTPTPAGIAAMKGEEFRRTALEGASK